MFPWVMAFQNNEGRLVDRVLMVIIYCTIAGGLTILRFYSSFASRVLGILGVGIGFGLGFYGLYQRKKRGPDPA